MVGEVGKTYLLVDEHGNDEDRDEENNDEDDNDTGLTLGPVLVALGELVESVLGASGDGHADGGHCVCLWVSGVEMLERLFVRAAVKTWKDSRSWRSTGQAHWARAIHSQETSRA